MGTYYRRPSEFVSSVGSTRLVTVPTSPETQIVLNSGFWGMTICNVGPSSLVWGSSNLTSSSSNLLYYSMTKSFENVSDGFNFWIIADSVSGVLAVSEYRQ